MHPVDSSFDAAIRDHDEAVAATGLDVWIGSEPTFTDPRSEAPEWLSEALGETKQGYARRLVKRLCDSYPGSIILRTVGRQYPNEAKPRWSLGLYRRRDGQAVADGLPADPLEQACATDMAQVETFWHRLTAALDRNGWAATECRVEGDGGLRILFRSDGQRPVADPAGDPRLARHALHSEAAPAGGIVDDLAGEGLYLVALGFARDEPECALQPCIELPGFGEVALFLEFVQRVAQAAREAGLTELVWRGFPPPVDNTVAWDTVTPDPAVVEVNAAPTDSVAEFLATSRTLYRLVEEEQLAPYRLQYNGKISESGGGGQFTLGGPQPLQSPFFVAPHLLGQLVTYLNHHPALSYRFAPAYVGSYSQSPRTDENVPESFSELQLALQQLAATTAPEPELIWRSLSPFLVDNSGNAHRSELNIEKLWNPYLPDRGCLGLVEFRAFRMSPDAETAASIAALLRAVVAMLSRRSERSRLIEWGGELHDRFALPFYLRRDLQAVFADLEAAGLGLGSPIEQRLYDDNWRHIGQVEFAGCRLEVEQAIEFWPVLGDAAMHEGGSRLVDASTTRLQVTLRPCGATAAGLDGWQLLANSYRVPLRREQDESGPVSIAGLRYRAFVPWAGLHPNVPAQGPIVLTLLPATGDTVLRVTLHDWQPQGLPYDGLPASIGEAKRRIAERFVAEELAASAATDPREPPGEALTDYCFDLRRT